MIGLNVGVLSHVFGSSDENVVAAGDDAFDLLNGLEAIFVVYQMSKNLSSA